MFKEMNILRPFFEYPGREYNVREVARLLKISPATASKELKRLVQLGLLRERKERALNLYKADLESDLYRDVKRFYNVRKLKESGLIDSLNEFYLKPTIVLFGSASAGLDTETSDFDLLVVSEKAEAFPRVKGFEKKLNRRLEIFAVVKVTDLRNPHLINNAANGIPLQGRVRWIEKSASGRG